MSAFFVDILNLMSYVRETLDHIGFDMSNIASKLVELQFLRKLSNSPGLLLPCLGLIYIGWLLTGWIPVLGILYFLILFGIGSTIVYKAFEPRPYEHETLAEYNQRKAREAEEMRDNSYLNSLLKKREERSKKDPYV